MLIRFPEPGCRRETATLSPSSYLDRRGAPTISFPLHHTKTVGYRRSGSMRNRMPPPERENKKKNNINDL